MLAQTLHIVWLVKEIRNTQAALCLHIPYLCHSSWLLADVCKYTAVNVKDVAVYEVGSV